MSTRKDVADEVEIAVEGTEAGGGEHVVDCDCEQCDEKQGLVSYSDCRIHSLRKDG